MRATGTALSCRSCGAAVSQGSRFCERCGTRLAVDLICMQCGTAIEPDARFCSRCGAKCFRPSEDNTAEELLLAATGLSLQQAAPQMILEACESCFRKNPSADHAAIAAVLATHANAKLGRFADAKEHVIKSRQFYATHLKLTPEQRERYVAEPYLIDDLLPAGDRDLENNPWLWPILGHAESPLLPDAYNGETEVARQRQALEAWVEFVANRRQGFIGILGLLSLTTTQYSSAARHLEKLLLIKRPYEQLDPCRPELLWPRVLLGDCYRETGVIDKAKRMWQRAASFRVCFAAEHGGFAQSVSHWIKKAESRLLEDGETLPAPEMTRRATGHLRQAMSYLLAAEQFETRGEDLTDRVRRAGSRYAELLQRALAELRETESLDMFAWAEVPIGDSERWCRYEWVKALALQKNAIWQWSNDRLALAVASLKEANELWPTLSFLAVMGGLQSACGLTADARQTYQTCIDRADELAAVESSEDSEQTLREVHEALRTLPN
jgi:tetratricopeptide (TPR) repeat protein